MNTIWKNESCQSSKVAICVVYIKLEELELLSWRGCNSGWWETLLHNEERAMSPSPIGSLTWLTQPSPICLNYSQQHFQAVPEESGVHADMPSLLHVCTLTVLGACKLFSSPNSLWPIFSNFFILKTSEVLVYLLSSFFFFFFFSQYVCMVQVI